MDGLDIKALCESLSMQIHDQVAELTPYDHLPASVVFPAVCVFLRPGEDAVDYHMTHGDSSTFPTEGALSGVKLKVRCFAGGHDDQAAQHSIYEYMAAGAGHPRSVFNAIYASSGRFAALGLTQSTLLRAARFLGLVQSDHDGSLVAAWGCEFDVDIYLQR